MNKNIILLNDVYKNKYIKKKNKLFLPNNIKIDEINSLYSDFTIIKLDMPLSNYKYKIIIDNKIDTIIEKDIFKMSVKEVEILQKIWYKDENIFLENKELYVSFDILKNTIILKKKIDDKPKTENTEINSTIADISSDRDNK